MKKYQLTIDTSVRDEIHIALISGSEIIEKKVRNINHSSQVLLPAIDDLLRHNRLNYNLIERINVNTGPGSFTGLRVGMTVAGILAMLLSIPLNNMEKQTIPDINYEPSKFD